MVNVGAVSGGVLTVVVPIIPCNVTSDGKLMVPLPNNAFVIDVVVVGALFVTRCTMVGPRLGC